MRKSPKETPVIIYRHKNSNTLVKKFYEANKEFYKTSKDINLSDFGGENKEVTINEAIKYVQKMGYWGFALVDGKNKEIRYWVGKNKNIDIFKVTNLIFHELTHWGGAESEITAMKYGILAEAAVKVLLDEFKDKILEYYGK